MTTFLGLAAIAAIPLIAVVAFTAGVLLHLKPLPKPKGKR